MFLGSFKTEFSGKNRLILPKRFRRELGNEEKFYILLGENGEIWGFNSENWYKLTEKILESVLSTEEGRVTRLKIFPKAEECVLDSQGRFVLPQEFMDKLKFGEDIAIIGGGDHFEIWDLKLWEKQQEQLI
jgi:MraZ protein